VYFYLGIAKSRENIDVIAPNDIDGSIRCQKGISNQILEIFNDKSSSWHLG
jgi:hypothetical protein